MTKSETTWAQLLVEAVTNPGAMLEAYRAFHNYSVGNQLLAWEQCQARGLSVGPIATYKAWKAKKRQVMKGSKALQLCMPVTYKTTVVDRETGMEAEETRQRFIYRRNWFVISQTDGEDLPVEPIPDWDRDTALSNLGIEQVPFATMNGNAQGYAVGSTIAINPVAQLPDKTTFHELAHVVLGHTAEATKVSDSETLPRSLQEAEAESVALLCLESLDLKGAQYCRGYIQSWLAGAEIPERSAQRIFSATDKILKAGRV